MLAGLYVTLWRHSGQTDLVVGNVLGSNIFNSLPVAGVAGLLATKPLDPAFGLSLGAMAVGTAVVAGLFLRSGHRVSRVEGALLLAGYVVVAVLLF